MIHKSSALIEFKVNQAIGSFAIEGISTSKEEKLLMLSIALPIQRKFVHLYWKNISQSRCIHKFDGKTKLPCHNSGA